MEILEASLADVVAESQELNGNGYEDFNRIKGLYEYPDNVFIYND